MLCWSKDNVSNNNNLFLSCQFKNINAIKYLAFTLKIVDILLKLQIPLKKHFLTIIKLIYTGMK